MTRDTAERARELAEWLHQLLCAAQNLPWEEGDCCDDCIENVKEGALSLLTQIQAEGFDKAVQMYLDPHSPNSQSVVERWLLAYQVGEAKDGDCKGIMGNIARKIQSEARLEEAKKWKPLECQQESHHPLRSPICRTCQKMARWEERIAALVQALQPEEKEGT